MSTEDWSIPIQALLSPSEPQEPGQSPPQSHRAGWSSPPSTGQAKRILYYAPLGALPAHLQAGAAQVRDSIAHSPPPSLGPVHSKVHVELDPDWQMHTALQRLHHDYYNLVVIDMRELGGAPYLSDGAIHSTFAFLGALANESDIEARYGFHRVMVLLAGPDTDLVDQVIAKLGARGVGRVLRDYSSQSPSSAEPPNAQGQEFRRLLGAEVLRLMLERRKGKRALCASGGGTTGAYFELGALKCLDDCLPPHAINSFDMYFGISAGAVVTGLLANGYSVDECMASMAGIDGGRIPQTNLRLFQWMHVNFLDMRHRWTRALRRMGLSFWQVLRGKNRITPESLFLEYGDLFGAPFHTDSFHAQLQQIFSLPGATNDFRRLSRPLYIGATDQDSRTHVLFGDGGWDHIPISQAIQASMSINPIFGSTPIHNRYYIDGAVTRTSNFVQAIKKGADLLLVLDPFLPYVSKEPGYTRQRGTFYNIDQDIRTISYTRFEHVRNLILHHYPQVSCYTFLPANRLRKLMSVNPMDHRPFLPIWQGAYLSTLQRINLLRYRLCGDLAAHGLSFDTSRAEAVAERLRRTTSPTFADFFPDGRIELRVAPHLPAPLGPRPVASVLDALSPTLLPASI